MASFCTGLDATKLNEVCDYFAIPNGERWDYLYYLYTRGIDAAIDRVVTDMAEVGDYSLRQFNDMYVTDGEEARKDMEAERIAQRMHDQGLLVLTAVSVLVILFLAWMGTR